MVLTYRFAPRVREFLDQAATFAATGGRACFLSGAFLGGAVRVVAVAGRARRCSRRRSAHPRPRRRGARPDRRRARPRRRRTTGSGSCSSTRAARSSEVSISCTAAITPSRTEVEIFGPEGSLAVDGRADRRDEVFANLRRDFATVARTGGPHPCDAARGLHLQHLIALATAAARPPEPTRPTPLRLCRPAFLEQLHGADGGGGWVGNNAGWRSRRRRGDGDGRRPSRA